jgi:hypothetical protein
MDFKASSTNWIWAGKNGSAMNTDDKSIALTQHDAGSNGPFSFDSSAKGGSNSNPFTAIHTTTGCVPTTKLKIRSRIFGFPNRQVPAVTLFKRYNLSAEHLVRRAVQGDCSTASNTSDGERNRLVMIHGYLACFIFAVVFPSGGIMMRLLNFKGLLWAHAALQIFGYFGYIGSAGMGLWLIVHEYTVSIP